MAGTRYLQVIAHRGGAALRIENTLAAFAHAIEVGADGAELDVHLTRDGEVVVHHDDALNPGYCRDAQGAWIDANQRPRIADLTFAELQRYDISRPRPGSDYARRHPRIVPAPDQRVPLLRDVIRLVKARSRRFRLIIEIKTPMPDAARQPWRDLLAATLDIVREEDFVARATLCSFDWGALVAARQQCPELSTWHTTAPLSWFEPGQPPPEDDPPDAAELSLLRKQYASGKAAWLAGLDPRQPGGYPEAVAKAGGGAWFMVEGDCTAERVRALAGRGLLAATWGLTMPGRDALAQLLDTGVNSVCLDDPGVALHTRAD